MCDSEFLAVISNARDNEIRVIVNYPCSQADINLAFRKAKIKKRSDYEHLYFDIEREDKEYNLNMVENISKSSLSEINHLANILSAMTVEDKIKFGAALLIQGDNISDAICLAKHIDTVMLERNIFNYREYGFKCWTQKNEEVERLIDSLPTDPLCLKAKSYLDLLWASVDMEMYGQLCLQNEIHAFTYSGLVRFDYKGISLDFNKNDIPVDQRINMDEAVKFASKARNDKAR